MLDNMDDEEISKCLGLRAGDVKFEISGNVDLETVRRIAGLGADFISVGRITHSVTRFDFSITSPPGDGRSDE
jgi:nicotinate-nucleotide pyrophosphorylase (carboxylating)